MFEKVDAVLPTTGPGPGANPQQPDAGPEFTSATMPAPADGHFVAYPTIDGDVAMVIGMSDSVAGKILSVDEALELSRQLFGAAVTIDPDAADQ